MGTLDDGKRAFQAGQVAAAIALFARAAVEGAPNAWVLLGRALERAGRTPEAFLAYRVAQDQDPAGSLPRDGLASVCRGPRQPLLAWRELARHAALGGPQVGWRRGADRFVVDRAGLHVLGQGDRPVPIDPARALAAPGRPPGVPLETVDETWAGTDAPSAGPGALLAALEATLGHPADRTPWPAALDLPLGAAPAALVAAAHRRADEPWLLAALRQEALSLALWYGQATGAACAIRGGDRPFAGRLGTLLLAGGAVGQGPLKLALERQGQSPPGPGRRLGELLVASGTPEAIVQAASAVQPPVTPRTGEGDDVGELLVRWGALSRADWEAVRAAAHSGSDPSARLAGRTDPRNLARAQEVRRRKAVLAASGAYRLGEVLVGAGFLDRAGLSRALAWQVDQPLHLGELLAEHGLVAPERVLEGLWLQQARLDAAAEAGLPPVVRPDPPEEARAAAEAGPAAGGRRRRWPLVALAAGGATLALLVALGAGTGRGPFAWLATLGGSPSVHTAAGPGAVGGGVAGTGATSATGSDGAGAVDPLPGPANAPATWQGGGLNLHRYETASGPAPGENARFSAGAAPGGFQPDSAAAVGPGVTGGALDPRQAFHPGAGPHGAVPAGPGARPGGRISGEPPGPLGARSLAADPLPRLSAQALAAPGGLGNLVASGLDRARAAEIRFREADARIAGDPADPRAGDRAQQLARVRQVRRSSATFRFQLAEALHAQGQDRSATAQYLGALNADPSFGAPCYRVARTVLDLGDRRTGNALLRRYLTLAPDGEFAADARARLARP